MPVVPVLTSARFLAARGEIGDGPTKDEPDWAELVVVEVEGRDGTGQPSADASWAGSYWSYGYPNFMDGGETKFLDEYRSMSVAGYPLMTDPDLVEDFYYAHGHVDFQEYYQS